MINVFRAVLIGIVAMTVALPAQAETLKLTASAWSPYVDAGTREHGFAMALLATALKRAGYETQVSLEPWPRALEATADGRYDVIGAVWYREERGQSLAFSEPYIECEIALIKRADSDFRFDGRESLIGRTIGVVDDYAYSRQAVDRTDLDVLSTGSVAESVAMLGDGEIDLAVADRRVALFHINERALAKRFDVLPEPLLKRGLRIAVSKTRPDYEKIIEAFEDEIDAMRADGSYDAILASFRVSTW